MKKHLSPWIQTENIIERFGLLDQMPYARMAINLPAMSWIPYVFLEPCHIKRDLFSDPWNNYVYFKNVEELKNHMDKILVYSGYNLLTQEQWDKYITLL